MAKITPEIRENIKKEIQVIEELDASIEFYKREFGVTTEVSISKLTFYQKVGQVRATVTVFRADADASTTQTVRCRYYIDELVRHAKCRANIIIPL